MNRITMTIMFLIVTINAGCLNSGGGNAHGPAGVYAQAQR